MATKKYGIKFPFTTDSTFKSFIDLNETPMGYLKSCLLHILLTPVGQRIRKPNFGSSLYKKLFLILNDETLGSIREEMNGYIQEYFTNITITTLEVTKGEDNRTANVKFDFEVKNGDMIIQDNINLDL